MSDVRADDYSDSQQDKLVLELNDDLSKVLQQHPEISEFISKLQERIELQNQKISHYRHTLNSHEIKVMVEKTTQTTVALNESLEKWTPNGDNPSSISEQVKQAAESALQQSGFVYEETSGLYYDYSTGYYYDAAQGLYYDGTLGIYYRYDDESKSYQFHSQIESTETTTATKKSKREKKQSATLLDKDEEKLNVEKDTPEDGECSDSDENSTSSAASDSPTGSEDHDKHDHDMAKIYPPCMRIIVKETNLQQLKIGSLFVVAYTGGSLGREGDHAVLIPDINISKHHARFYYEADRKQYEIVDMGSRNGTILNGKRLSVAKQESSPFHVTHGSIVQVGNTKLLCHIHNGHETCGHCEPGLIQQSDNNSGCIVSKQHLYKSELKRLKNKFGVEKDNTNVASHVARGYRDRAQARRDCVGSSNHYAKTQQSSVDISIAKDNKGFKLLSKMGWSEGQSLGKEGDGRTEPVPMVNNSTKTGFGAQGPEIPSEIDASVEKKQALWRKTRRRYDQLS